MSLAVNPAGDRAYLVTSQAKSQNTPVIYQERVGGSWNPPPAFPEASDRPNLALTPSGNAWVSCNTGTSTGDVIVAHNLGTAWDVQFAANAQTSANPDARITPLGSQGDDLMMCFQGPNNRLAFSSRLNGIWWPDFTGNPPGPLIPTLGRLRMSSGPAGWPSWVLTSRGNGGYTGGAQLSATSVSDAGWSTLDVTDTVSVDGCAWVAVSSSNRVHVVYQVRDNTTGGTTGMRLRYAAFDAPPPAPLAVEPETRALDLKLTILPSCVRSGEPIALRFSAPSSSRVDLAVCDIEGRRIRSRTVDRASAGAGLSWDLGPLPSGVYLVRMESEHGSISRRFVVLR